MKEINMKMYLKECTSKLEFWSNKNVIMMYNKIKSKKVKKIYNFFIRYLININFIIKYLCSKPIIKKINNDSFLCIVPIDIEKINNSKFMHFLYNKCVKNINRNLINCNIRYSILSKKISKLEDINMICKTNSIEILKGKYLFKAMILDVLNYILEIRGEKIESQAIHVVVNENSNINIDLIEYLSSNVKNLNVVTSQIKKFQRLEQYLYDKKDIMIVVANNKKKSLQRAEIIINIDLSQEELLKYQINRNAIVINLSKNVIEMKKSFNGIIANLLEIGRLHSSSVNGESLFKNIEVYESTIIDKVCLKEILDKIKEDKIFVDYLTGGRGKIQKMEYIKLA